jgi:hypothetical protein
MTLQHRMSETAGWTICTHARPRAAPTIDCSCARVPLKKHNTRWRLSPHRHTACTRARAGLYPGLTSSLNPVKAKTKGPVNVRLMGAPMLGGMYSASFVPKRAKGFKLFRPEASEGEYMWVTRASGRPALVARSLPRRQL